MFSNAGLHHASADYLCRKNEIPNINKHFSKDFEGGIEEWFLLQTMQLKQFKSYSISKYHNEKSDILNTFTTWQATDPK